MLGTLAIALACACVVLVAEQGRVVMESGVRMRANENAFFDMLAAKDKSKGVPQKAEFHRRFTGRQERAAADKYFASLANRPISDDPRVLRPHPRKMVHSVAAHHVARPVVHHKPVVRPAPHPSFSMEFAKAHEQLMREKAKMRALSEADHVKVEKQKFKLEQMSAKSQAHAYMKHLEDLSAKVFPSEDIDSASATKSITHALTDDMSNNFDKGVKGKHAAYHHPHKPPLHLHHPPKPHTYHKYTPPSRMYTIGDPTPPLFTDSKKAPGAKSGEVDSSQLY